MFWPPTSPSIEAIRAPAAAARRKATTTSSPIGIVDAVVHGRHSDPTAAGGDGRAGLRQLGTYLNLVIEEMGFRRMRHREFDVSEMSFSSYLVSMSCEEPPFIAIPVPFLRFHHGQGLSPRLIAPEELSAHSYQIAREIQ